ncbi:MAG: nucleoside deaminase [Rikenellaceae bacterium]|nr:nucleoside deaminase [Rikenellaceae bacterium]
MEDYKFTAEDRRFMQMAIDLSIANVANGGGPFGAVIVHNGEVIATGTNRVTANNDPTAHAEVSAIREACAKVGNFKLEGCVCYTSCEPCPMCLSALYWAGVSRIVYGNTKDDAKAINFDDSFIYDEIGKPYAKRAIPCQNFMRKEALEGFRAWTEKEDKIEY